MKTHLKIIKGAGSAHHGAKEWLALRLSSIALVPLCFWLVYNIARLAHVHAQHQDVLLWVKQPINAVLASILIPVTFYHSFGGLKEIIEDYIHNDFVKIAILFTLKSLFVILTAASLLSVLYINFKL